MLTTIRDNITGWIAAVIVGLLVVSFALWGVSFYFTQDGQIEVASVNGEPIQLRAYQRTFYNLRQQMQTTLERTLTPADDAVIKEQALTGMIDAAVVNKIISEENLQLSNDRVRAAVQDLEVFQNEESEFDRALYERNILRVGIEPAEFERQMRLELLSEQLQNALTESAFVLDDEVKRIAALRNQKRDLSYAILSTDSYIDEVMVSDEDIEEYYEKNPQLYKEREKVKIAYLDLDVEKLAREVEVDEDDLQAYYNANRDKFDLPEQRRVTQLFAKIDEDGSLEKARTNIEAALPMLKTGKTFEEIVEILDESGAAEIEFSEQGPIQQGIMQDEVDSFLFSADEGDISDPIQSKDGFHIVKVGAIKGGPNNTFDNLREEVDAEYRQIQAENQFIEQSEIMTDLAYAHPDTLDPAAEATGMEIYETDFFSREEKEGEITGQAKIISASFSDDIRDAGNNSDPIEISDTRIVVLRVIEQQPEKLRALSEVKALITETIKTSRAQETAQTLGNEIIDRLQAGEDLSAIAEEYKVEWVEKKQIQRDNTDVNRAVLRAAFRLDTLQQEVPIYSGVQVGGDFAVIILFAVEDAATVEIDAELQKRVHDLLNRRFADNEWKQFLNGAKDDTDVTIYRNNL